MADVTHNVGFACTTKENTALSCASVRNPWSYARNMGIADLITGS